MNNLEGLLLEGINSIRSNPTGYYKNLEKSLKKMNKGEIVIRDSRCKIKNVKYALELLEDLKNMNKLNLLDYSNKLKHVSEYFLKNCLAEEDIINYMDNITSQNLVDEVIKYCTPYGIVGISYIISNGDSNDILLRLLVDENSNTRANRNLMLCIDIKHVGISCNYFKQDQVLTILVYCQEFIEQENQLSTPTKLNDSISNQSPIVNLVDCNDRSPIDKDLVGCEELINHIYNSERIIQNIKVEKRTIKDKSNRNFTFIIKQITYTNGDFEEIANKL